MSVGAGLLVAWFLIYLRRSREAKTSVSALAQSLKDQPIKAIGEILSAAEHLDSVQFERVAKRSNLFRAVRSQIGLLLSTAEGREALARFYLNRTVSGRRPPELTFWDRAAVFDPERIGGIVDIFAHCPDDSPAHELGIGLLTAQKGVPNDLSEWAYQYTLKSLEQRPESIPRRTLALGVGRWHYGNVRRNGRPTIYDEEAMQNDIMTRAGR